VTEIGDNAKKLLGRIPGHYSIKRPMQDGVIADPPVVEEMLRLFIQQVASN